MRSGVYLLILTFLLTVVACKKNSVEDYANCTGCGFMNCPKSYSANYYVDVWYNDTTLGYTKKVEVDFATPDSIVVNDDDLIYYSSIQQAGNYRRYSSVPPGSNNPFRSYLNVNPANDSAIYEVHTLAGGVSNKYPVISTYKFLLKCKQ